MRSPKSQSWEMTRSGQGSEVQLQGVKEESKELNLINLIFELKNYYYSGHYLY